MGKVCSAVVREDIVAIDPISRLLADGIKERVLVTFKGEHGIEVWKDELVRWLRHWGSWLEGILLWYFLVFGP